MANRSNSPTSRASVPSPRRRRLPLVWIVVAVILLAALIALFIIRPWQAPASTPTPSDATTSESSTPTSVKGETQSQSDQTKTPEGNDALIEEKTPAKYEGSGASSDGVTGVITYADTTASGYFVVRVSLDQYLADGTCTLTLSGAGNYTASAPIVPSASTSTCQGFDIPLSSLSAGSYDIRIDITSGSLSGTLTGKGEI